MSAVLAPGSKRVEDIKSFSGVALDTKRHETNANVRVVTIQVRGYCKRKCALELNFFESRKEESA